MIILMVKATLANMFWHCNGRDIAKTMRLSLGRRFKVSVVDYDPVARTTIMRFSCHGFAQIKDGHWTSLVRKRRRPAAKRRRQRVVTILVKA